MTADIKKFLSGLLVRVEGLHSILITDRDGVPVVAVSNDKASELAMRMSFLSTFGMATDQGSKLGHGKNNSIIVMYSNHQVVQITKLPLVLSFIASQDCNTGHILDLEKKIDPVLNQLKCAFKDA